MLSGRTEAFFGIVEVATEHVSVIVPLIVPATQPPPRMGPVEEGEGGQCAARLRGLASHLEGTTVKPARSFADLILSHQRGVVMIAVGKRMFTSGALRRFRQGSVLRRRKVIVINAVPTRLDLFIRSSVLAYLPGLEKGAPVGSEHGGAAYLAIDTGITAGFGRNGVNSYAPSKSPRRYRTKGQHYSIIPFT